MNNLLPKFQNPYYLTWLLLICFFVASPAAWSAGKKLNLSAMNSSQQTSKTQAKSKSSGQSNKHCKAGSRLSHLGQVIKHIQNGKPPSKPVRIPANRLLQFNPIVLKKLGSHYTVINSNCNTIPVVNGKLIQKVTVNFAPLANAVASAISSGNKKQVSFLTKSFKAAPVKPIAGLSLVKAANYSHNLQSKISKTLGINMRKLHKRKRNKNSSRINHVKVLLMSDLYVRLGGHLTHSKTVTVEYSGKVKTTQNGHRRKFDVANLLSQHILSSALRAMGYKTRHG